MRSADKRFSRRHGYLGAARETKVREDAPARLREGLVQVAVHEGRATPEGLREVVCRLLRRRPAYDQNWSDSNVLAEVQDLLDHCEWFRVYDVIEAIHAALRDGELLSAEDRLSPSLSRPDAADRFEEGINELFAELGIGWQLVEGSVQVRGSDVFEAAVRHSVESVADAGRTTAKTEIEEALKDLSRRPEPDVTGAIQHAMAGLECLARDVAGDPKATLGEILKRYPGLIPKPIDQALDKLWGYASEMGRHVREGRLPDREEAEMLVSIAVTVATYLVGKLA